MPSARRFAVALFAGPVLLLPRTAAANAGFWLVVATGNESQYHCKSELEDYWACILGATDFNTYVASYDGFGDTAPPRKMSPLTFAGSFLADTNGCYGMAWEDMLTCVVDKAGVPIHDGDFVAWVSEPGNWDVRNCSDCVVHGKHIGGALLRSNNKCDDYTFGSIHEALEGNTWGGSDDCCNGRTTDTTSTGRHYEDGSCAKWAPGGWIHVTCGYRDYVMQPVTKGPRSDNIFYGDDCHAVNVTAAAGSPAEVCTLPHDDRAKGRCVGDDWVTCPYALVDTPCDDGCVTSPMPHCGKVAASCTVRAPKSICEGKTAAVSVTCTNTGDVAWDTSFVLEAIGSGPKAGPIASPLADSSWISPEIAAALKAPVAPGASGTFAFEIHGETVGATTQHFSLGKKAGKTFGTPADLALSIDVTSCASAGAGGAAGHGGASGGAGMGTSAGHAGTAGATAGHAGMAIANAGSGAGAGGTKPNALVVEQQAADATSCSCEIAGKRTRKTAAVAIVVAIACGLRRVSRRRS